MNKIPEKLINFRVYLDGVDLLGLADAELPELEAMTETVSGAGIAGEVDSPTLGHFKSATLKLKWRTVNQDLTVLAKPKAHHLDLRGSIQRYDAGAGEYQPMAYKVVCKAIPKKTPLGKLEVGKPQDAEQEFEVVYIKVWLDDKEVMEIDKYNFIAKVNGEDALADVRQHLGLN